MNYYIDTEFLEGTQTKRILGFPVGKTKPTIDLISIGIVAEDGREYYAISKDFNLKEAWNRWQQRTGEGDRNNTEPRLYWIRENVLKPIWEELVQKWALAEEAANRVNCTTGYNPPIKFTCKNFKRLINEYGKTNKQIAEEIKAFCKPQRKYDIVQPITIEYSEIQNPVFYGYYADYDWVVFCWLFGKMLDLPNGFPMYCRDLKQMLDESFLLRSDIQKPKHHPRYPKQTNEHNALADARWNKELHEFIQSL
jgi:hypothetical protein